MRIKAIASICKKSKRITLYEDSAGGIQWISNGYAAYPLLKMPHLSEKTVYTVLDIPDKQRAKMHFGNEELPGDLCFDDTDETENRLDKDTICIAYADRTLKALNTSQGLLFIDTKYLTPLADHEDYLTMYERTDKNGRIYIAVKNGLMLCAVILPYDVINERFVVQMKDFAVQCENALEFKRKREG